MNGAQGRRLFLASASAKWPDRHGKAGMKIRFSKMHGLGNDFVVIDAVRQQIGLTSAQARWLADRHFGVGCDQILVVEKTD